MANVDIKLGYKDLTWFNANPTLVLKIGQIVYLAQTGTYKIGDGVTQLSALTFLGGSGTVDVNTIGAAINGAASATPNDTDLVMSVDTSVAKKNTWTEIKAFLKTYFDTVYTTTSAVATQITTALTGYATQAWVTSHGYITNVITALGYTPEDTSNKTSIVTGNETSTSKYLTVKGVYDWVTGLFVKKGTLTTNTIPKATASDTIGNSQITDDGTNVGIVGNIQIGGVADARLYIKNANGNYYFAVENGGGLSIFYINPNGRVSIGTLQDLYKLKVDGSFASATIVDDGANVGINTLPSEKLHVNGNIRCDNLTASQIVETDASKNLVSAAKGTAYNKNFGTTAGTVLEGDRITQTITNGVTDKAPSEDAVFDALALKLTAANNLSDLANPLTARNNLKMWDLFLTGGNQSTTSNVATNITDLVSPTLTASKRYRIHGVIKVGCNNTGGVKFQITLPSGASMDVSLSGSNTSNTTYINATITSSATLSASVQSFNGASILRVDGEISLGVTAGTIQFGFASGTNTQTSTVYQLGTQLTLTQIN